MKSNLENIESAEENICAYNVDYTCKKYLSNINKQLLTHLNRLIMP